eukprot:6625288-Ditylum_brightwellii.AAC.1
MEQLTNNPAPSIAPHCLFIHCLLLQEQKPKAITQDSGHQEIHHINKLSSTSINLFTATIQKEIS